MHCLLTSAQGGLKGLELSRDRHVLHAGLALSKHILLFIEDHCSQGPVCASSCSRMQPPGALAAQGMLPGFSGRQCSCSTCAHARYHYV